MTWNISWEGRATDFEPNLLNTLGKPGKVAQIARDALWEAVQKAAEADGQAWVKVSGHGWEHPTDLGLGKMVLSVELMPEPGEIQTKIAEQQPVDLRTDGS